MTHYSIGIDFGTNSARAIIVDCTDGSELGEHVFPYPTGHQGILLDEKDHNLARQYPGDYIQGLEATINGALTQAESKSGFDRGQVIGIGIDTTGSTPMPVDENGTPLGMLPQWKDNLAAQAWLWKDHTAAEEARKITDLAAKHRPEYLAKCGSTYSSEWFWSKIWHCLKTAPEVFEAAYSWVEYADWLPAVLAGNTDPLVLKRGVCPAGHKAMYCAEWGGLPDKEFLTMCDPKLADLRDRLYEEAFDASVPAGELCDDWATRLDLPPGTPIAIGAFDAHYGSVGSGVAEGTLVKIIGTSTCDTTVTPLKNNLADIPGVCGIVNGSILPGHYGIEAGQSAVGDIFKWFVEVLCEDNESAHQRLTEEASKLKAGESGLLALDWNNGNRCILVDPELSGVVLGQSLHTTKAEMYRALIEATAFGARAIIERMEEYGVRVDRVVCAGGIAEKNPMLMQIYADVLGCTMQVTGSSQACALGSALAAAVCAGSDKGGYDDFAQAQKAMTSVKDTQYIPDAANRAVYDRIYALYGCMHDAFGGVETPKAMGHIMKELLKMKAEQSA